MQVYTYWHRGRAIVLIPAETEAEADRAFQIQYGSLSPVQSNLYEARKQWQWMF